MSFMMDSKGLDAYGSKMNKAHYYYKINVRIENSWSFLRCVVTKLLSHLQKHDMYLFKTSEQVKPILGWLQNTMYVWYMDMKEKTRKSNSSNKRAMSDRGYVCLRQYLTEAMPNRGNVWLKQCLTDGMFH
jgi:hypothetical protein